MRFLFIIIFVGSTLLLKSQSEQLQQVITIHLPENGVPEERNAHGFVPLYKVSGTKVFRTRDTLEIIYPKGFHAEDTAFGTEYFTGLPEGSFKRSIGLLVKNYSSPFPEIYADHNNNLDFSNDGAAVAIDQTDSIAVIAFRNHQDSNAVFEVAFKRPKIESDEDEKALEGFFNRERLLEMGIPLLRAAHWLDDIRYNNRKTITSLDGHSVKVVLHDYDCNGFYNNSGKDRIFIRAASEKYTTQRTSGIFTYIKDSTLFSFKGQVYRIVEVDPAGRFISFHPTNEPFEKPLASGEPMPDLKMTDEDGKEYQLSSFLDGKRYILFDVWGSWCKGCHVGAESLSNLNKDFGDRLLIVGVNSGDTPESRSKYIEKYGHNWLHLMMTEEFSGTFLVDAHPTYILIDPSGKVVNLYTHPAEVETILSGL